MVADVGKENETDSLPHEVTHKSLFLSFHRIDQKRSAGLFLCEQTVSGKGQDSDNHLQHLWRHDMPFVS